MQTKFTMKDRIILTTSALPVQGSFTDMILRDDIIQKVRVTQEEVTLYQVTTNPGTGVKWEEELTPESFDYEFTPAEVVYIANSLKKMDKEQKISPDHIGLYKMFAVAPGVPENK